MKKSISLILSASFIMAFCIATIEKTLSQATGTVKEPETTETKKAALFNEGGYVNGITPQRAVGLAELLFGILGVAISVRAKKRSSTTGAKIALTLALLAFASSLVHLVTTSGAVFGSGSGKAGAILAIILSLIGIILSGLVLGKKKGVTGIG